MMTRTSEPSFLDLLRDQLWETYAADITAMMQEASTVHPNEKQIALDFNDDSDF